jgi:hypothetical protein
MFTRTVIAAAALVLATLGLASAQDSVNTSRVGCYDVNDVWQLNQRKSADSTLTIAAGITADKDGQAYIAQHHKKIASPNYAIPSVETIYPGNVSRILQIAYSKISVTAMTNHDLEALFTKNTSTTSITAIAQGE